MPPVVQSVPMPVVLQHVMHVLPVNTMANPVKRLNLLLVKNAERANTMTKPVKLLVKVVVQGNTKMKLEKHRATIVLVPW
jgi:hypothetical protein